MALFDKLRRGLAKTRDLMFTDVRDLLKSGRLVNDDFLDELEAKLIRTDMGVAAATRITVFAAGCAKPPASLQCPSLRARR